MWKFTHLFRTEDMTLEKWHQFLGHPSFSTLKHMKQLSRLFQQQVVVAIKQCEICLRAKHTREPFPLLNRRTYQPFELVHADVWGPYSEESVSNTRFVLTLVEDHSRAIWTYLLSSKDLVCPILASFIQMVKTHFHRNIKYFISDNGTEFITRKVHDLFAHHGIIHQRTCVYTP